MIPTPRQVSQDLLDRLDPLERIVAERFLREGRFVLSEHPEKTCKIGVTCR